MVRKNSNFFDILFFLRSEEVNGGDIFSLKNEELQNMVDLFNAESHIIEIRHLFFKVLLRDNGSHTYNSVDTSVTYKWT